MMLTDKQLWDAYKAASGGDLREDIKAICTELGLPEAVLEEAVRLAGSTGMQKPMASQALDRLWKDPYEDRNSWLAALLVARAASVTPEPSVEAPRSGAGRQGRAGTLPRTALLLILPPNAAPRPTAGGQPSAGEVAELNLARAFWSGPARDLAPVEAVAQPPRGPQRGEVSLVRILFAQPDPRFDAGSTSAQRRAALRDLPADCVIEHIGNVAEADPSLIALDPRNW